MAKTKPLHPAIEAVSETDIFSSTGDQCLTSPTEEKAGDGRLRRQSEEIHTAVFAMDMDIIAPLYPVLRVLFSYL